MANPREWLINGSVGQAGGNSYAMTVTADTSVQVTFKTYYASWSAARGLTGGVLEDFDHDGVSNLLEMAFGTDPKVANAGVIALNGAGITQRGSQTMWLQNIANGVDRRALYGRRKDYVASGLTYTVQFSGDLVSWTDSTATPAVVAGDAEIDAVTVPYPLFVNGRKARFFRVQVTIP